MDLVRAQVERVIGTSGQDYAVVLRAENKSFLIFVGQPEVVAIFRELHDESVQRPMPHDVVANVIRAFDIEIRLIVISSIVESVFCATLLLARQRADATDGIEKDEVRLDLRASDAMILALKTHNPLWVARDVLDQVEDVTPALPAEDDDSEDSSGEEEDP